MIEYKRLYHNNGQLWRERPLKDGKMHGIGRWWYSDGQLAYEDPYQEGEYHGVSKGYDVDGTLHYTRYYLYDNEVTEEEYRRHILIEGLAGL